MFDFVSQDPAEAEAEVQFCRFNLVDAQLLLWRGGSGKLRCSSVKFEDHCNSNSSKALRH
ncbi:unnamed protein product [Acidithrix sp. C25]|nr:unnamed protein product [Acidithrix sp. C25]